MGVTGGGVCDDHKKISPMDAFSLWHKDVPLKVVLFA